MHGDGRDDERTCPRCGGSMAGGGGEAVTCPSCGRASLPVLRVADGTGGSPAEPPPAVQLVREFKGPTVDQLLREEAMLARLPGQLRRVAQAVAAGDLQAAEARLDAALGQLHRGPGFRRRRWLRGCRWALWALASALLAAALAWGT